MSLFYYPQRRNRDLPLSPGRASSDPTAPLQGAPAPGRPATWGSRQPNCGGRHCWLLRGNGIVMFIVNSILNIPKLAIRLLDILSSQLFFVRDSWLWMLLGLLRHLVLLLLRKNYWCKHQNWINRVNWILKVRWLFVNPPTQSFNSLNQQGPPRTSWSTSTRIRSDPTTVRSLLGATSASPSSAFSSASSNASSVTGSQEGSKETGGGGGGTSAPTTDTAGGAASCSPLVCF